MYEISPTSLDLLTNKIEKYMGIHYGADKRPLLKKALIHACSGLAYTDMTAFINWALLETNKTHFVKRLAPYITIGETYFFRDPMCFQIISDKLIPSLLERKNAGQNRVKIWCAACASGEEPYSLAMFIKDNQITLSGLEFEIIASDIDRLALEKAKEGLYTDWSFRSISQSHKNRFFTKENSRQYKISEAIRNMVDFRYINLIEDGYPSEISGIQNIDILFCKNVLMYFDQATIDKTLDKLSMCLSDIGLLFVSPCEFHPPKSEGLSIDLYSGYPYYKKAKKNIKKEKPLQNGTAEARKMPKFHLDESRQSPSPAQSIAQSKTNLPHTPLKERAMEETAMIEIVAKETTMEEMIKNETTKKKTTVKETTKKETIKNKTTTKETIIKESTLNKARLNEDNLEEMGLEDMELECRRLADGGQLEEALNITDLLIKRDKTSAVYYYLHANVLLELGHDDQAREALKKAVFLEPANIICNFLLGNLELASGSFQTAKRYFTACKTSLEKLPADEAVPEAGGLLSQRMREIVQNIMDLYYK